MWLKLLKDVNSMRHKSDVPHFFMQQCTWKGKGLIIMEYSTGTVKKFNGRSISSVYKVREAADFIAETHVPDEGLVVVVSAIGDTTDNLIEYARTLGKGLSRREMDALLATGEQQAAALMAMALQKAGLPAVSVSGFQSGFLTNSDHTNAKIQEFDTEVIEEILAEGSIPVVAGFQGVNEDGDITTLGRSGSDITAVAIAAMLDWNCELYTTRKCLYSMDPEFHPDAKPIHYITYEEMMELANLGGDRIETRAVELAKKYNVRLYLGKIFDSNKESGTFVTSKEEVMNRNIYMEDMPVTGIGTQDNVSIFTLRNIPAGGKATAECFRILADMNINVDLISQQATSEDAFMVSFSCNTEEGKLLKPRLEEHPFFSNIEISQIDNLSIISLVGVGMATHSGVASKVFRVLADKNITYYHITTSEISISISVDMDCKLKAGLALAMEFHI